MKRIILGILLVLLVAQPATRMVAQPSPSLTIGTLEPLPALDPAASSSFFAWDVLTYLSTGLARQIPGTVDYELALAATHDASADGLEHRFTLRPDAAFNDGMPITASIAAESINRTLSLHENIALFGSGVQGMQARAEDGALLMTLDEPVPYLLGLLALPPFHPVHPDVFAPDRPSAVEEVTSYIGSGPYRPESTSRDELVLAADPGWRGNPPATPSLVLRHFAAPTTLRDALIKGEVDMAWRGLPAEDLDIALRSGEPIWETHAPGSQAFYLVYGLRNTPFDAFEARRALLPFFDRELATRTALRGRATPMLTLLPHALAGEQDPTFPPFDAEAGAAALRENGFSRFRRIEGDWLTSRAVYGDEYLAAIEALTRTLSRNPAVRIARFDAEPDTFFDQVERGTARAQFVGWAPAVPHPDAYLTPLLASTGQIAQAAGYANPEVDRLLRQAALASPDAARALYTQVQEIAAADLVTVPLWVPDLVLLARESVDPESLVISPNVRLHLDLLRRAG